MSGQAPHIVESEHSRLGLRQRRKRKIADKSAVRAMEMSDIGLYKGLVSLDPKRA
jgi:hypothetical protein